MYKEPVFANHVTSQKDISEVIKQWASIGNPQSIIIATKEFSTILFHAAISYLHECIDNPKKRFIPWVTIYKN
jgi:hypothetical protein